MEEQQERIVKGIWIPIEVWKDQNLTWNEKILLLEIDSYSSQDKDCFISNKHIAELLDINETNASKTLSSLVEKGYVIRTRFDGKHRFVKSALSQTTNQPCRKRQPSRARTNNNKLNNSIDTTNTTYQEKETDKSVSKKKGALDMSIVAPEMQEVVDTWLTYKKEKGQSYKPSGFISFYKKLCKLSNNNPQVAMAIVEESKSNNYAGIFPLKSNNNLYGRPKTNTEKFYDTIKSGNEFSKMLHDRIEQQAQMGDGDNDEIRRLQDIF